MTTYNVFCDSCAAEYSVTPLVGLEIPPTHCAYCGLEISEETISEKNQVFDQFGDLHRTMGDIASSPTRDFDFGEHFRGFFKKEHLYSRSTCVDSGKITRSTPTNYSNFHPLSS